MCDHVISRTRLCCRTLCHNLLCACVGRYICVAEFYLGSFQMIATHMCVTEGRSSWSQFPFAGLAYVSVFECASACASEASKHPLSRFL